MHYIFVSLVSLLGVSCTLYSRLEEPIEFPTNEQYTLDKPTKIYSLSSSLDEVSGISFINPNTLACVQDEKGKVYFYSLSKEGIIDELKFKKKGDFEDITFAKGKLYVLQSNGDVFKIKHFEKKEPVVKKYETKLKAENDTEGLCFDKEHDQLLVLCKEKPGAGNKQKNVRAVYAFDLDKKESSKKPILTIEVKNLLKFTGKKVFKPAAIGIHPITKNIFIVDSVGRVIIEITRDGEILSLDVLSKELLPQPEGLAFDALGNLYISTEVSNKEHASIAFFEFLSH